VHYGLRNNWPSRSPVILSASEGTAPLHFRVGEFVVEYESSRCEAYLGYVFHDAGYLLAYSAKTTAASSYPECSRAVPSALPPRRDHLDWMTVVVGDRNNSSAKAS